MRERKWGHKQFKKKQKDDRQSEVKKNNVCKNVCEPKTENSLATEEHPITLKEEHPRE